jgi:hypothetical protein
MQCLSVCCATDASADFADVFKNLHAGNGIDAPDPHAPHRESRAPPE